MMRNRTITALLALGLTGATAAYSQELVLTLDECLDMASEHDPYLVNSRLDVQAAIYRKQEAEAEYFPTVSLNAMGFKAFDPLLHLTLDDVLGHSDAANELKNQIGQTAPLYGIPTEFRALARGYGAMLSLSQPVYAGGRIVNGNRLARLGVEAARLQQELQEKQTASQVEEKYWQVVSLEEKRKTVDMAVATLDTLLRDVTQAREAGILTETELLQVRLERNRLRSDLVRLRGGLRLAKMDLFNVMGLGYSSTLAGSYDAEGKRLPFIDDIRLDSGMEDMHDPGIYHRPEEEIATSSEESRLLALSVESKKLQKKMTVGEALPTVGVGASYGYGDYIGAPGLNGMVYAMVKVPMTEWGKTSRKIRRSDIELRKALNEQEYLDEQLVLRTRQRWEEVVTAWDRIQIGEESVDFARSELEHCSSGLDAGLNTVSEVLQAQTALRQAEDALIDDRIAYVKAVREYLR